MKKLLYLAVILFVMAGCTQKKNNTSKTESDDVEMNDSTIYGVCGKGTMMHTLELITNMQDTLSIHINDEDSHDQTLVAGGLMCGDRMAVTAQKTEEGWVAQRVLNLTSLLGKWTSIDKSFEITDDGEVKSSIKIESNKWTTWRILNGQLLFNRDTFDIVGISADSLQIENKDGIFAYRRVVAASQDKNTAVKDSIAKK
jgi:hypothetical protein